MPLLDSAVEAIAHAEVIDKVAEKQSAALAPLLGRPSRLKDLLSGTPLGHPLHPVLVTVPIGSWTSASVLDFVGGRKGRAAAQTLVGLGLLSSLPTAAAGVSDWYDTAGEEKRVGVAHSAFNTISLGLYAASWLARRRGRHLRGVGLSLLGAGAMTAGAYLGGHLSYAYGVGVDTTAFQGGPEGWTDAGPLDDLPQGASAVEVAGVPVLVFRQGADLVAMADRCVHRGAPLHEGPVVDGCIECPWHGSRFSLAQASLGEVEQGPATRPQKTYDVRVQDGRVLLRRTPGQLASGLAVNSVGAG